MLVMGHKPNEIKEYKIVRDYYTYYHKKEGVLFVLANEEANQTFSRFLPRSEMNSNYDWKKVNSGDVHYISAGIESGEESKLIIETGFIKIKPRMGGKEKMYTYRKYRFVLKK